MHLYHFTMKTQSLLLICFFSAVSGEVFTVLEGEDFRQDFNIVAPERSSKYLCKKDCKEGDVLMEVHGRRTKSGRYNLRYDGQVHVTITQVTKADAGNYRVGVNSSSLGPAPYQDFQLIVKSLCENDMDKKPFEFSASKGADLTISCNLMLESRNRKFLCRNNCTKFLIDTNDCKGASSKYRIEFVSNRKFKVTIRDLSCLDSGLYRCGVGREFFPNSCQQFRVNVIADSDPNEQKDGKTDISKPTVTT